MSSLELLAGVPRPISGRRYRSKSTFLRTGFMRSVHFGTALSIKVDFPVIQTGFGFVARLVLTAKTQYKMNMSSYRGCFRCVNIFKNHCKIRSTTSLGYVLSFRWMSCPFWSLFGVCHFCCYLQRFLNSLRQACFHRVRSVQKLVFQL